MREDALQLYGFADGAERELFEHLLAVSGVGPKVALAIVSGSPPADLRRAIALEDTARFEAIPGIGKKTAQRVVLELKEKLGSVASPAEHGHVGARDALVELGYSPVRGRARPRPGRPGAPGRGAGAAGATGGGVTETQFLAPGVKLDEDELERSLRPRRLDEFVGQERVKEQLAIALEATRTRGEALDHVLLIGPPGLGKTSLAYIIREELGVGLRTAAGPALERKGDVAAILTALSERDILFIDEIHRLNRAVEEILYPALEDFRLDIIVGQGPAARTLTLDLPPFTLVGATTRTGLLTTPSPRPFRHDLPARALRARGARADRAALRADPRGRDRRRRRRRDRRPRPRDAADRQPDPRRVRDVAEVRHQGAITTAIAREALELLEVDGLGLERIDRALLRAVVEKFDGGPVGLSTLAVALGEEPDTIEDVYEPYLLQLGFLQRTPRGRIVTKLGRAHVGAARTATRASSSVRALAAGHVRAAGRARSSGSTCGSRRSPPSTAPPRGSTSTSTTAARSPCGRFRPSRDSDSSPSVRMQRTAPRNGSSPSAPSPASGCSTRRKRSRSASRSPRASPLVDERREHDVPAALVACARLGGLVAVALPAAMLELDPPSPSGRKRTSSSVDGLNSSMCPVDRQRCCSRQRSPPVSCSSTPPIVQAHRRSALITWPAGASFESCERLATSRSCAR